LAHVPRDLGGVDDRRFVGLDLGQFLADIH
jgi:hypothetical protein